MPSKTKTNRGKRNNSVKDKKTNTHTKKRYNGAKKQSGGSAAIEINGQELDSFLETFYSNDAKLSFNGKMNILNKYTLKLKLKRLENYEEIYEAYKNKHSELREESGQQRKERLAGSKKGKDYWKGLFSKVSAKSRDSDTFNSLREHLTTLYKENVELDKMMSELIIKFTNIETVNQKIEKTITSINNAYKIMTSNIRVREEGVEEEGTPQSEEEREEEGTEREGEELQFKSGTTTTVGEGSESRINQQSEQESETATPAPSQTLRKEPDTANPSTSTTTEEEEV